MKRSVAPPAIAVQVLPDRCGRRHCPTTCFRSTSMACTLRWPSRNATTNPPGMAVNKLVATPSTCSANAALPSTFHNAPAGTNSPLWLRCRRSSTMRPWFVPTTTQESRLSMVPGTWQSVSTESEMISSRLLPSPKSRSHFEDNVQTLPASSSTPSKSLRCTSAEVGDSWQAATRWPCAWSTMTSQRGSCLVFAAPLQSTATSRFAWPSSAGQYGAGAKVSSRKVVPLLPGNASSFNEAK
mmetsp:Transcript_37526/g.96007  ORF Transcript_37526/g.96007 Transcript_37526/m.96007 type:complete len:240 (-) Transcript_37526:1502-2221(-)